MGTPICWASWMRWCACTPTHQAYPRARWLPTPHTHVPGGSTHCTPTHWAHPPGRHTHLLGTHTCWASWMEWSACTPTCRAHPPAGHTHPPGTPTCQAAPHSAHPPMGQLFLLHICCSLTSPTQSLPPCWGSGLLQTRVRSRIPPAQVAVQADHGDQGLHRPSTGGGRTARSCGDGICTGTQLGL